MKISDKDKLVIEELLSYEHRVIANNLKLIDIKISPIEKPLLYRAIGLIDRLSRCSDEKSKRIVITLCSILWTYKNTEWDALKDFFILVLSRVGFAPSSIMVDDKFSNEKYSSFNSFVNQVITTVHHLDNEIVLQENKFLVTSFQKRVWEKLSHLKLVGISAPTSAGKSFVILLKAIDLILKKNGNVIYIVPTLSLVAQVSSDFNQMLKRFGIKNYKITTTYNLNLHQDDYIYVLTQEKALAAFSQSILPFPNVRALVIDEIQNIERVANENDQRSKTLYDTLIEFRYSCDPDLTIISGPRVDGLKSLGIEIFNEESSDEERTKGSPVANFTYAISRKDKSYYFKQYSDILEKPGSIQVSNGQLIKGYGKALYNDDFIKYLYTLLSNLGENARNLVFAPTARQARKTAMKLAELQNVRIKDEKVKSLIDYIKSTVHSKFDLCYTIEKGYVYHHGKSPAHIRAVVETAVREKIINNVICTTTLMQGVNLPGQNVIMRNPYLAILAKEGSKPRLTDYEIANLRGRAGRLLKDFIGRTYVLEEGAFDNQDGQIELFQENEKTLRSGYGDLFKEYKDAIKEGISKNTVPNDDNKEFSFLITYIRQSVLRHGIEGRERLASVGIQITEKQIANIKRSMDQLTVPKDVCLKNRYWDPIDLENLFNQSKNFIIPTHINDDNIENKLAVILRKLFDAFPVYYKRYFDIAQPLLYSCSISAKEWMKETPLKRILSKSYFNTADKIEDQNCIDSK